MSEVPESLDQLDNRFFKRGFIVAALYAIVDALILFVPGPWLPFRFIGVIAGYYATRDTIVLREAGLDWGKTRYALIAFVGAGGFLGYFFYAYRRTIHLRNADLEPAENEA